MAARIECVLNDCQIIPMPSQQKYPLIVQGKCDWITQHAIDRYRERTQSKKSDASILKHIENWLCQSVEMQLKDKFKLDEALSHDAPARYFKFHDMIFVVDSGVVLTAHQGTADRWIKKL